MLAWIGFSLPYTVAVLSIVLCRESIRSVHYYTSSRLTTWDTLTACLTFGALLLGCALCWPWLRARGAGKSSRVRWILICMAALLVQFVGVFVVRFFVYVRSGGIL